MVVFPSSRCMWNELRTYACVLLQTKKWSRAAPPSRTQSASVNQAYFVFLTKPVRFAKNVQSKSLIHNSTCWVTHFFSAVSMHIQYQSKVFAQTVMFYICRLLTSHLCHISELLVLPKQAELLVKLTSFRLCKFLIFWLVVHEPFMYVITILLRMIVWCSVFSLLHTLMTHYMTQELALWL